jgi:hypothetical protein
MEAPLASLALADCRYDPMDTESLPPFLDGFADAAYSQLTDALSARFGTPHTCANPDGAPRAPLRYSRQRVRVLVGRHRIDLIQSDVILEGGERADADLERECPAS